MNKPVLFLNCPNIPLFLKKSKDALSVSVGGGFLVGAIKHFGFPVDYFDLNLALNNHRSDTLTPTASIDALSNLSRFFTEYHMREDPILNEWLNYLISRINKKNEYLAIFLSLDTKDTSSLCNKAALGFAFMLARELKIHFNAPIILGGQNSLRISGSRNLPNSYHQSITNHLKESPIDLISEERVFLGIGKFLTELASGKSVKSESAVSFLHTAGDLKEASEFPPSYDFANMNDILVDRESYLPEEVLRSVEAKFPKLREIEPFFIAPYKFTMGCPYTCAFCFDGNPDKYYQHRVEKIVDIFYKLQKSGITNFSLFHNNINLNLAFLQSWKELMKEAGVNIRFADSANLQNANDDFFSTLRDLGCIRLWYGTETVSDRLLRYINKDLNRQKIERGLALASKYDIWNSCNFIYNFPHETEQDFRELVNFIRDCDFVDSYETNEFRLILDSPMGKDPERFGLDLIVTSENKKLGAFNEKDGLTWEERRELGIRKTKELREIVRPQFQFLTYNDHLVFAMRSIGMNKMEMKEVVKTYSTFLRENRLQKKFGEKHFHTLPRHLFPESKSSQKIHGMDANLKDARAPAMP